MQKLAIQDILEEGEVLESESSKASVQNTRQTLGEDARRESEAIGFLPYRSISSDFLHHTRMKRFVHSNLQICEKDMFGFGLGSRKMNDERPSILKLARHDTDRSLKLGTKKENPPFHKNMSFGGGRLIDPLEECEHTFKLTVYIVISMITIAWIMCHCHHGSLLAFLLMAELCLHITAEQTKLLIAVPSSVGNGLFKPLSLFQSFLTHLSLPGLQVGTYCVYAWLAGKGSPFWLYVCIAIIWCCNRHRHHSTINVGWAAGMMASCSAGIPHSSLPLGLPILINQW